MDPNTLTLYLVAGGLSCCLSLVLFVFARFQPHTRLAVSWAIGLQIFAAALVVSGFGPALPRWATVIGTNMTMVAAATFMYSGARAYCRDESPRLDVVGWVITALTLPAFWYWGLVSVNGNLRVAVHAFATAAVLVRVAVLFLRAAAGQPGRAPEWALGILFGGLTLWMAGRGLTMLVAPLPAEFRGTNPTSWSTVFWFIVSASALAVSTMWLEVHRLHHDAGPAHGPKGLAGLVSYFQNKLFLLWSAVIVLIVGTVGLLGIAYAQFLGTERTRLFDRADTANTNLVQYLDMSLRQVDATLKAVREFHTVSAAGRATSAFIQSLGADASLIDVVCVTDASGAVVAGCADQAHGFGAAHRESLVSVRSAAQDALSVVLVAPEREPGPPSLLLARRIVRADGAFDGVVSATVNAAALARRYRSAGVSPDARSWLISTTEPRQLLAIPAPQGTGADAVGKLVPWNQVGLAKAGHYESPSANGKDHQYSAYSRVFDLPMVVVTSFSHRDVRANAEERLRWLAAASFAMLVVVLMLALLLTIEAKRRDEQERFISMLSHELKTPMSTIVMALGGMEGPDSLKQPIARSVAAMKSLVDRCLQSDRMSQGRVRVERQRCAVEPLLREACLATGHQELIDRQLEPELAAVWSDPQLLTIIVSNLLDNAIKYRATNTRVTLQARHAKNAGAPGLLFEVTNLAGAAGLPDPGQVFQKYYRAAGAHGQVGSGLGLYIAAELADKLGGVLRYLPAAGSVTFTLWIPTRSLDQP